MRNRADKYSALLKQIFRFGIVGIACTAIDYVLMVFLTEIFGINSVISSGISFTVSVVANYLLSMRFVFRSKEDMSKQREFALFVLLSMIGLLLNMLLMWLAVDGLGIHYMIAKLLVTAMVTVYNYLSKKLVLEKKG